MKQKNSDIKEIVDRSPFLADLDGKTIFVTGATGLIGSALTRSLLSFNGRHGTDIRTIALVRDIEKASAVLGTDRSLEFIEGTIENLPEIKMHVDYIVHGASSTSSRDFIEKPVDVLNNGLKGSLNVFELGRRKGVKKCIYLSSSEVYGRNTSFKVTEKDVGVIDWTSVRSSYIEVKRTSETLALSYFSQYRTPMIIARLTLTFGACFRESDNRVYAQFIRAVKSGRDIVLKTKGETVRNYCYITDAVSGLLTLLHRGTAGEIYNVANEETTCSIKEMAELAIRLGDGRSRLVFDVHENPTELGYYPTVKIKLVSEKLRALGWRPRVGLEQAFLRMMDKQKD